MIKLGPLGSRFGFETCNLSKQYLKSLIPTSYAKCRHHYQQQAVSDL
jgi:hypothetical protein